MKSEKAKETHHPISEWAKLELEDFFAPLNDALAALLKFKVASPQTLLQPPALPNALSQKIQWQEVASTQEGLILFIFVLKPLL